MRIDKLLAFAGIAASGFGLVASPSVRGADLIHDSFAAAKNATLAGRVPDITNAPDGQWSVVAFNTGGGFSASTDAGTGNPAPAAHLICGGNSTGAIAIPISQKGAASKWQALTISADLRGADPALGFYSALATPDPDGAFDAFSNFTGLRLRGDGTLALYRKGGLVSSVKYTGTFDAKEFHTLSYTIDWTTQALREVKLQGSTSDYSILEAKDGLPEAAITVWAAVASLCEGGRDNQAYADNFKVSEAIGTTKPPGRIAFSRASASSSVLVHRAGEKIGFMGDSITQLGNSPRGYVQLVIAGLKEVGVDASAIPAGHSGDTSGNMVTRTNIDVLHQGATWMTISCGVNDVLGQDRGVGCDLESYKKNVRRMVAKAQGWGVKVLLLTATPLREEAKNEYNGKLAAYNDFLRTLAREKKLPLADVNAAFWEELHRPLPAGAKEGSRLLADGVHPNDAGQFLMAMTVLKAMGVPKRELPRVEKALRETTKIK